MREAAKRTDPILLRLGAKQAAELLEQTKPEHHACRLPARVGDREKLRGGHRSYQL